jgi:mono/diheme cytochrome c family protein
MIRRLTFLGSLILLSALTACSDMGDAPTDPGDPGPPDPPDPTVSFADDIQPIFDNNCVGCHGVGGNAGLDLRPDVSHGNLVNIPSTQSALALIEPEEPDDSWLYLKITGQQNVGSEMPPGSGLDSTAAALIQTWIMEGALDN